MTQAGKHRALNYLLLFLSLVIGIVVCEMILRTVRPPSDIFPAHPTPDPILGHRILPFQSGHDEKGYRNETAEGFFPIVIIGDSYVYGSGVSRKYAIPQQLGVLLHKRVYNMAMGGFGPVQYYHLLKEAEKMSPQQIIVALTLTNDLMDAYYMVTRYSYWHWLQEGINADKSIAGLPVCTAKEFKVVDYSDPNIITLRLKESGSIIWEIHSYLRLHFVLYALPYEEIIKPLLQRIFEKKKHLQQPGVFYSDQMNTVFMPGIYLGGVELRDERVRLGLLATGRIIELIGREKKDKAGLLFVIIPTKENVYYRFLKERGVALPPEYECLVTYEREITQWLAEAVQAQGFHFFNLLPAMEKAALKGALLYPTTSDCHPNAKGCRLIAKTLFEALKQNQRPSGK